MNKEKVSKYLSSKGFKNDLITGIVTFLAIILMLLYNFMKSGFKLDNYTDPAYYVDSIFLIVVLWLLRYAWSNRAKYTFRNSPKYTVEMDIINGCRDMIELQDSENKSQVVIDDLNRERKLKKYRTVLSNEIIEIDKKLHKLEMKKDSKRNLRKSSKLKKERDLLSDRRKLVDDSANGKDTTLDIEDIAVEYQPLSKAVLFSEASSISIDDELIMNTSKVFYKRNFKTNIMTTIISLMLVGLSMDAAISGDWFRLFMMISLGVATALLSYTSMMNIEKYENLPLVRKRKEYVIQIIRICGFAPQNKKDSN
jgi:hypothetical protein